MYLESHSSTSQDLGTVYLNSSSGAFQAHSNGFDLNCIHSGVLISRTSDGTQDSFPCSCKITSNLVLQSQGHSLCSGKL